MSCNTIFIVSAGEEIYELTNPEGQCWVIKDPESGP